MATKLKNLHLTSVDLVRAGANQKADIRIHKSADDPETPGEGIFKRFLKWLRDEPSAAQEVPAEPIEKDSSTFNQINNNRDLTDKLWRYTDALTCSLNSIRDDNDLDNGQKALMMKTSLRQFSTAMEALIDDLCQTAILLPEAVGKSVANRFDEIEEVCKFNPYHGADGRFTSANGGAAGGSGGSSAAAADGDKKEYGEAGGGFTSPSSNEFHSALSAAKESVDEDNRWRVDVHEADDYKKDKLFASPGGSVVAVTPDGDIISVCKNTNDKEVRGSDLLKKAVENGGTKLDAFSGLYGFYAKNGFEPVSWVKFDENYAPEGWTKGKHAPEDVVFWKYTGKKTNLTTFDMFKNTVDPSSDYDTAYAARDAALEG